MAARAEPARQTAVIREISEQKALNIDRDIRDDAAASDNQKPVRALALGVREIGRYIDPMSGAL
jgi:hypothetical protein